MYGRHRCAMRLGIHDAYPNLSPFSWKIAIASLGWESLAGAGCHDPARIGVCGPWIAAALQWRGAVTASTGYAGLHSTMVARADESSRARTACGAWAGRCMSWPACSAWQSPLTMTSSRPSRQCRLTLPGTLCGGSDWPARSTTRMTSMSRDLNSAWVLAPASRAPNGVTSMACVLGAKVWDMAITSMHCGQSSIVPASTAADQALPCR